MSEDYVSVKRAELQSKLEDILGSAHVYFEPPENVKMQYPCIVYERDAGDIVFANNNPYRFEVRYNITAISRKADNPILGKLALALPKIRYDRHFMSNSLHHDVFAVYY